MLIEWISSRPDRGAAVASSIRDIDSEMAIAFRPIVRGFLISLCVYYGLLTLSYLVFPPTDYPMWEYVGMVTLLSSSSLAACLMYQSSARSSSKHAMEVYNLVASAITLANLAIHMSLHFQAANLVYYILAMPVFAISCVSMRAMIAGAVVTVATMMVFITIHVPSLLVDYLFLALAASFAATGMATLMRRTLLRAIEARMEADANRGKAETFAAKADALARQTRDQAERDPLTGLANRFSFFNVFGTALAGRRTAAQDTILALIDLDGFKPVNDAYGYAVGDQLLGDAGRRILAVVPRRSSVARLGGDEFAILLRRDRLKVSLEEFARRLCASLGEPYIIDNVQANISASVGLVVCDRTDLSIRQLMERGDFALRAAKKTARGEAVMFSARHEKDMLNLGKIDQTLRACPLDTELRVVFQPQYDLEQGQTYGFEALGRWDSPILGPVRPDIFIKAAETTGLIRKITQILLRKTLDAVSQWPEHLHVSFNLSGHDLMSPVSVSEILDLVKQSGIAPNRIEFEITETAMMADIDQARRSIERIAALGCKLALDDFGAGYSNFSYLHQLPVNKIKIDRSFVTPLLKDASASKIIRTIINLGHSLDLDCVIEGVESKAELDLLREMNARYIQGYIFGRPMESSTVATYLDAEAQTAPTAAPARPATATNASVAKFPVRRR
ncbi:putative bifunctional diguanylate cyclase/phosphodiesterase [Maricaulis sp.]|uniref:putative bifunctional diguanylate cyclase/phosphodiesterase n=1 Tax=Maricaulis sp. TaxID=1486257 RepID=UPI003A8F1607